MLFRSMKRLLKRLPLSSENYAIAAEADNKASMGEAEISSDIIDIEGLEEAPTPKAALPASPIAEATKSKRKQDAAQNDNAADPLQAAIDSLEAPSPVSASEVREWNNARATPFDDANLIANVKAAVGQIIDKRGA